MTGRLIDSAVEEMRRNFGTLRLRTFDGRPLTAADIRAGRRKPAPVTSCRVAVHVGNIGDGTRPVDDVWLEGTIETLPGGRITFDWDRPLPELPLDDAFDALVSAARPGDDHAGKIREAAGDGETGDLLDHVLTAVERKVVLDGRVRDEITTLPRNAEEAGGGTTSGAYGADTFGEDLDVRLAAARDVVSARVGYVCLLASEEGAGTRVKVGLSERDPKPRAEAAAAALGRPMTVLRVVYMPDCFTFARALKDTLAPRRTGTSLDARDDGWFDLPAREACRVMDNLLDATGCYDPVVVREPRDA